ncbi:protein of unknown function [Streptomyces murinus]
MSSPRTSESGAVEAGRGPHGRVIADLTDGWSYERVIDARLTRRPLAPTRATDHPVAHGEMRSMRQ